jgi:hypothetical protein
MRHTSIAAACLTLGFLAAPAPAQELPPSLGVVPGDAAGFLTVDVRGVLASPMLEEVRFVLGAIKPDELAAFARKFPVDPTTVERVVVVLPNSATVTDPFPDTHPTAVSAIAVFGCSKPFDPVALGKGFFPNGRPKSYRGRVYRFNEESWNGLLVLPGNRAFVVGAEDSLVWLIDRLEKGDVAGPLSPARAEAVGHTLFLAVNPAAAMPAALKLPPPLRPLADARRVCVAVDLGETIKGGAALHYQTDAGAAAGEKAVKAAVALTRDKVKELEGRLRQTIDKPAPGDRPVGPGEFPERFGALLGVGALRRFDEAVEKLPVEREGTVVRVTGEMKLRYSLPLLVVGGIAGITALGQNANETFQYVGNSIKVGGGPSGPPPEEVRLKKLAAAFEAYHAGHGHYPPAATAAKDGSPLLSWRVALLPYLGEQKLYDEFRQDEPWDSLHNKRLIARMPEVFGKPYSYPKNYGRTNTQVVTGPGTLFSGPTGAKKPAGAAIILALEADAGDTVWWTKPADLVSAPGRPPEVFGKFEYGSCYALFTDGNVKWLQKRTDEKRLPELTQVPNPP